jgi:Zn-dependent protease with chaperone function
MPTNFFERQAEARRTSLRLRLLFALAVVAVVLAVDAALWIGLGLSTSRLPDPQFLLMASVGTLAVIGVSSLYRMASLRAGGAAVAMQLGGSAVAEDTRDPQLRRLRNVVEEMAIASGVPVPQVFVLEDEAGVNAFAAGHTPADATIAVTRGALERLNRDELQGVIAHEFSHVLNGDMRMNLQLMGWLFGILVLTIIGRRVLEFSPRVRSSRDRNGGVVLLIALALIVIGYIGLLFARMIKAGISRSHERLADASAVQFTRQNTGLAGALKKIAGVEAGSRLSRRADAEEVSHMLFGDGLGFSGLFATHPPLLERIQALEPGFRAEALDELRQRWTDAPPDGLAEDSALGLVSPAAPLPAPAHTVALDPVTVATQIARPADDDYRRAGTLLESLPAALRERVLDRDGAWQIPLALLVAAEPATATRQGALLAAQDTAKSAAAVLALAQGPLAALHPLQRLPLAMLAFPRLRRRPADDLRRYRTLVAALVQADADVSLFEYCLGRVLDAQLARTLDPAGASLHGRARLAEMRDAASALLAAVAVAGHDDAEAARRAFLTGALRLFPDNPPAFVPPQLPLPQTLDAAFARLATLDPLARAPLVEALTEAILQDGRATVAESELLRTVCAVLDCPLPPRLERTGG